MVASKVKSLFIGTEADDHGITLRPLDRATHMQVIGATGAGKSKFLEHMIRQDILNRDGVCVIDPVGNLYHDLVRWCTQKGLLGTDRILLFDPTDPEWTFGFNPVAFGDIDPRDLSLYVDAMVRACAQVWGGEDMDRTPRLKKCLRSVFYVLADKRLTLLEAIHLINHESLAIRRYLTQEMSDEIVRLQWDAFDALSPREFREQFDSTENRMSEFLTAPRIRNIIGQTEDTLDMRAIMDSGKVLLVNLSYKGGKLSEANGNLLGALLINDIYLKTMGRPRYSRPFYVYIDECHRYINEDIQKILDMGRQCGVHLILAHQHLSQLREAGEKTYGAVMTNARTKVVFSGLSPDDATEMARHIYMGEIDMEEPKETLNKPMVVGQHKEILRSEAYTSGVSRSESHGWSSASHDSTSEGYTIREDAELGDSGTLITGSGWGRSAGESGASGEATVDTHSEGTHETYVSDFKVLPTAVHSLEEQYHKKAAHLRLLKKQRAVVKMPSRECSADIAVPFVEESYARDERVRRDQIKGFECCCFAAPVAVVEERIAQRLTVLREAAGVGLAITPQPKGRTLRGKAQPVADDDDEEDWTG